MCIRDRYCCRNSVSLSVCLSVRLSIRCVYCDKTKQRTTNTLIPHKTAITLVYIRGCIYMSILTASLWILLFAYPLQLFVTAIHNKWIYNYVVRTNYLIEFYRYNLGQIALVKFWNVATEIVPMCVAMLASNNQRVLNVQWIISGTEMTSTALCPAQLLTKVNEMSQTKGYRFWS